MYPLRTGSAAVDAFVILICLGDFQQFRASLGIDLPHFPAHLGGVGGEFSIRYGGGRGIWRRI